MGMFDNLRCKFPLPGVMPAAGDLQFQTKSLDCLMDDFEIREDGSLWHQQYDVRVEQTPDSFFGCVIHQDNKRWVRVLLSGEIRFYGWQGKENSVEFLGFYWKGELREIHCLEAVGPMALQHKTD